MQTGGAEVQLFAFSASPLIKLGGQVHAPAALTMVLIEQEFGWTPGDTLDDLEMRTILYFYRDSNPVLSRP
jgi:hypothetical protein